MHKKQLCFRVCKNTRVPRSPRPPQCPTAHPHKSFCAHPSVQEHTRTQMPTTPTPMCNRRCSQKCFVLSGVHKSTRTRMPTPTPVPNRLAKNGQARRQVLFAISGVLIIVHKKRQKSHHAADSAVVFFIWSAGAVIEDKGDVSKLQATSNNCFDNCFNFTLRASQMRPHCFEMHFLFLHSNQRQAHLKQFRRCVQGFQSVDV